MLLIPALLSIVRFYLLAYELGYVSQLGGVICPASAQTPKGSQVHEDNNKAQGECLAVTPSHLPSQAYTWSGKGWECESLAKDAGQGGPLTPLCLDVTCTASPWLRFGWLVWSVLAARPCRLWWIKAVAVPESP